MGPAKRDPGGGSPVRREPVPALPAEVRSALTPGVARAWRKLLPHLPPELYLAGGTATALHLHHRVSQDLDFFYHGNSVDLQALEREFTQIGVAVTFRAPGTLRTLVGDTKVEFLHADEARTQHLIESPAIVAGVPVAGLKDLIAMKLKALAERGELRDYYDVMQIDQQGGISVEDGIALYLQRYGLDRASDALPHLIRALGYLEDTDEDEQLPITKTQLNSWWRQRQARLIRNLGP